MFFILTPDSFPAAHTRNSQSKPPPPISTPPNLHTPTPRLYKTVFPTGLDEYRTPAQTPSPSPLSSQAPSRKSSALSLGSVSTTTTTTTTVAPAQPAKSLFGRWTSSSLLTVPKFTSNGSTPTVEETVDPVVDGPIEDFVVAGTAFGKLYCYYYLSLRANALSLSLCRVRVI